MEFNESIIDGHDAIGRRPAGSINPRSAIQQGCRGLKVEAGQGDDDPETNTMTVAPEQTLVSQGLLARILFMVGMSSS